MEKKLIRPKEGRVIAGVCAGIANYFKVDVVIVRLIFVLLLVAQGSGALIYLILLIVMPDEGGKSYADKVREEANSKNKEKIKDGANKAAGEIKKATQGVKGEVVLAYALILIGALFLVNNLFPTISFGRSWPLILVVIGIIILLPSGGKEKDDSK